MSIRDRMSVSIRSLTILRVLRTVEQRGLAVSQITLLCSWSVVCIESGSDQALLVHLLSYNAMNTQTNQPTKQPIPSCRVLPKKIILPQLVTNFPVSDDTCRFVAQFTTANYMFLSRAISIQFMPCNPIS